MRRLSLLHLEMLQKVFSNFVNIANTLLHDYIMLIFTGRYSCRVRLLLCLVFLKLSINSCRSIIISTIKGLNTLMVIAQVAKMVVGVTFVKAIMVKISISVGEVVVYWRFSALSTRIDGVVADTLALGSSAELVHLLDLLLGSMCSLIKFY